MDAKCFLNYRQFSYRLRKILENFTIQIYVVRVLSFPLTQALSFYDIKQVWSLKEKIENLYYFLTILYITFLHARL